MTVKFMPPRVPLVDLRTGTITREWYLLFQGLFTGDGIADEDMPLISPAMSGDAIAATLNRIADTFATSPPPAPALGLIDDLRPSVIPSVPTLDDLAPVAMPVTRIGLGAAAAGANTDITSLAGLTTPLSVAQGGSGAANAANARLNFGLGTIVSTTVGVTVSTPSGMVMIGENSSAPGAVTALSLNGSLTGGGLVGLFGVPSNGALVVQATGVLYILGSKVNIATVPTFANDAAAGAGGLGAGDIYKNATGSLMIKL